MDKRRRWIREASCLSICFIGGWGDSSSGPLIPYIQAYYGISYTVVSMLFVGQMVGYLVTALTGGWLSNKLGMGKLMVIGAALQSFSYAMLIPAFSSFAVMPVMYAIGGVGLGLLSAQCNVFLAAQPKSEIKLSVGMAAYGLGGAVCPLAATAFASSGILFARFWSISLGLALANTAFLAYSFQFSYRFDTDEPAPPSASLHRAGEIEMLPQTGPSPAPTIDEQSSVEGKATATNPSPVELPNLQTELPTTRASPQGGSLREALSNRTTVFCSLFVFLYVGAEVSMGGWIVTFMTENRDGGPDAGYIASGFWLGLMLGRILLIPLNARLGEQNVIYLYTGLALALEFSVWFARNLVGNAVVVAFIGLLLGPSYPILVSVVTKILPRRLHSYCISFIAAFGQTGSAVFPFITGALAQKFSPVALHPVLVVLFAAQIAAWAGVPRLGRKKE
ncbi:hypothetical protein JCM10207_004249 [Rhodosporidiobolus poonsookiae]